MLGVQRPGVTGTLNVLAAQEFISVESRLIKIQNRFGLLRLANGFYGASETEQTRLTGWESSKH